MVFLAGADARGTSRNPLNPPDNPPVTSPVGTYLSELHKIHAMGAGTEEISLYNPLQNLLNGNK